MSEQFISILQQRRIEANVIKPLIIAFEKELGHEKTKQILADVIKELAYQHGNTLRNTAPNNSLQTFKTLLEPWLHGNALEIDLLEADENTFNFNVTRCRYAEMYKDLGLTDLGYVLSCNRDASLIKGFSDKIELTRTQTIMEGASYCNFRYTRNDKG